MDKERLPFGRLLTSAAWPFVPLGLVVLIVGFMFAWVMRDGLGPDSHRTYGPEAWSHFLILYVPIASLGLFLLLYGLVIFFLGLFTERLSCLSKALILMLAPVAAIGFVGFAMTILTSGEPAGQPHINTLNYSIEQYNLSLADAYAYSFAVTAGDYYEVISTYDSFESQQPGGFCYERGGLPWRLRNHHGCAIHAFTDSLESFQDMLNNPSSAYPSGIQDPGVFARDLRANRAGANFGLRAFHNPLSLPSPRP